MKFFLKVVLCLLIIRALLGSVVALESGTVVEKRYKPPHVGRVYSSESYKLIVYGRTEKGEERTETWHVSRDMFDLVNVGDTVIQRGGTVEIYTSEEGEQGEWLK